ncbi:hypothetical protein TeGR_g8280 [Tetraparma gracilis]|uniref:HYDIN/VesB/CFA65-like Ig-like domain-containing protein n=1 Tax=Tetraparma gracilis TaxID=2962635 RepID=A0ABQ6M6P6_9STRA|nr:hypothetical protein TeGR_g8280 [Tetraparma gracilis]
MGPRPVLSFPDSIDFGTSAVKDGRSKNLIVRNVGSCAAHFSLDCGSGVFAATPADGLVEVGQTVMVTVTFTATGAGEFEGELAVEYHGQDVHQKTSYVSLKGVAENVEVFLSRPSLAQEPTYISLSSQKSVKVCNKSEIPVRFDWRAFHSPEDEEAERSRLLAELEEMEALEEAALEEEMGTVGRDPEDSDGSLSGDEGNVPPAVRAARAALRQK